jgi:hypothetical protein
VYDLGLKIKIGFFAVRRNPKLESTAGDRGLEKSNITNCYGFVIHHSSHHGVFALRMHFHRGINPVLYNAYSILKSGLYWFILVKSLGDMLKD